MNSQRFFRRFGWTPIVVAFVVSGCGGGLNAPAAKVGNSVITQGDYYSYLEQKGSMLVNVQGHVINAQLVGTPGFQALKDLIINKVILRIAKDDGVLPTSADIQQELTYQEGGNKNLMTQALSRGYTPQMVEDQIDINLAKFRIVTKGVTVTDDEVNQFIKDHPDQFMSPPAIDASMIIVDSGAKKNQVDASLNKGEPFDTVAAQYSVQPNGVAMRYRYPVQDPSKMPPQIASLLNSTDVNHSTNWVSAQNSFVKFYVNQKTPASPLKITPYLKEQVRRALMQEKGMSAVDFDNRVKNELIKLKDKIVIEQKAPQTEWKQFIDQLSNNTQFSAGGANSTATAGGTTGSAPSAPTAPPATSTKTH